MDQTFVVSGKSAQSFYYMSFAYKKQLLLMVLKFQEGSIGEQSQLELQHLTKMDLNFWFLDEPFAGVDPIAISEIQKIVAKLGEQNMGILITEL